MKRMSQTALLMNLQLGSGEALGSKMASIERCIDGKVDERSSHVLLVPSHRKCSDAVLRLVREPPCTAWIAA